MPLSLMGGAGICRRSGCTTRDIIVNGSMRADWVPSIDVRGRDGWKGVWLMAWSWNRSWVDDPSAGAFSDVLYRCLYQRSHFLQLLAV